MQKLYKIKVDISKKYAMPAFEVNTNDLKSIKLSIEVLSGASPLDLKDKTVRIAIRKPDNNIVFQDCEIKDAAAGQVEVILENQAYITPGTHTAEIMCYKGSDVVAVSGTFSYKSTKGIMNDEAVESKSEFTAIDRKIEAARKLLEDIGENGVGVDEQARQKIEEVTRQLTDKTQLTNKRVSVTNEVSAKSGGLEVANFAGQGTLEKIIGFILHHYTDGNVAQYDNVGDGNNILVLKNAHNPQRRPDKPSDFVGNGRFLVLTSHNQTLGYAQDLFYLSKDAEMVWTGVKGIATLVQNKQDDGIYAFRIKNNNAHLNILDIVNGSNQVLFLQNNVNKTRVDVVTSAAQTNGMFFETKAGALRFKSGSGQTEFIGSLRVGDGTAQGWKNLQTVSRSATDSRPTTNLEAGFMHYDTTLKKPIWYDGAGWRDAMGTTV